MNGILDKQTSSNNWAEPLRTMLHERLETDIADRPSEADQHILIQEYEREMLDSEQAFADLLRKIQRSFMLTSVAEVESFLRMNRSVAPLLLEAVPHFLEYFKDSPLVLDVMAEEGTPSTINVLAFWRGEREQARQALKDFDEHWWIDNLRKASGKVVFDYELQK